MSLNSRNAPSPVAGGAATAVASSWWRRTGFLSAVGQAALVAGVCLAGWWLYGNLVDNLTRTRIPTDFDFLTQPTGFAIPENFGFDPDLPIWRMVLIGVQNTFLAGLVGVLLASIVGLAVGIARLSSNWLVARLAQVYVEGFRNTPPLVVIVFFSFAVFSFGPLPVFPEALDLKLPGSDSNWLVLSKSRIGIPSLSAERHVGLFWLLVICGVVAAALMWIRRSRRHIRTGQPHHRVLWSLGVLVVVALIAFVALGGPYAWSFPARSENGRRLISGFGTSAAYLSLTLALALYTASHIAEVVRASILAVPKGQTEASSALALSPFQRYRHVVLPQGLRIAVPPTINQYLNLIKNTSLGTVVGYADVTNLTRTSIGNANPAPQSIAVLMGVYLVFSLVISLLLNIYNRTVQLRER
jgi:general L-amino acid transport system permease protein